jgi:aspartate-semialdehyde dehydrogenase
VGLKLLDADAGTGADAGGRITAAGDTALLVQPITADAFDGVDVVFFAEEGAMTQKHWTQAVFAKAVVVDLTGPLSREAGVATGSPSLAKTRSGHSAVVSAHPVAVMLSTLAIRLRAQWLDVVAAATVMVPASEYGSVGLDALHEQTTAC